MTTESVAESLVKESRLRRRRIAASWWPRARLTGEILWNQVERDRVFNLAAALTYKTLFSLLPIFVLSLLVLSTISAGGGKNALDNVVKEMLFQQMGLDRPIPIDSLREPAPANEASAPAASDPENTGAQTEPAATRREKRTITIAEIFEPLIEKAKRSVTSRATGLVAFAILLYGAISLMIVIEGAFNQIYGAVKPRSWPRRIMLYWCVLTLGPIGIAASIVLGNSAYHAATTVAGVGMLLSVVRLLSGFVVSWVLILLLYRVIPDTYVNWRPAVFSSFLAALAWEIGKWAFGLYVQNAVRHSWYGSLALLPLFMFWIYITWCVLLTGLEVSYVQQYWAMLKRRFFFTRAGGGQGPGAPVMSDLRWVLSLGVLLFKRFKAGKITEVHEAADALMLPNDIVGMLLDALERAHLVHEVREDAYALARPPEAITAYDLLTAARALCQVPPELARESPQVAAYPTSAALLQLEELENGWAKSHALPALAEEPTLAHS
jgi:membrane protein